MMVKKAAYREAIAAFASCIGRRPISERPERSGAADGDVVDADAGDSRAGVCAEVVADFGEAVPEVEVVAGDVHLGDWCRELAIFDGDADDAVREVAADAVLVSAEEPGDVDAVFDIGDHCVEAARARREDEVGRPAYSVLQRRGVPPGRTSSTRHPLHR